MPKKKCYNCGIVDRASTNIESDGGSTIIWELGMLDGQGLQMHLVYCRSCGTVNVYKPGWFGNTKFDQFLKYQIRLEKIKNGEMEREMLRVVTPRIQQAMKEDGILPSDWVVQGSYTGNKEQLKTNSKSTNTSYVWEEPDRLNDPIKCHNCGTIDYLHANNSGVSKLICSIHRSETHGEKYYVYCRTCFHICQYELAGYRKLKYNCVFNTKRLIAAHSGNYLFTSDTAITRAIVQDGLAQRMKNGSLRKLAPAPKEPKALTNKAIIECPSCMTKLRVPKGKSGKIRCPTCDELFEKST